MLGFDDNNSNSTQESSPKEEFNDPSNELSANQRSTCKKMAQHLVFHDHMVTEEVMEQGHIMEGSGTTD